LRKRISANKKTNAHAFKEKITQGLGKVYEFVLMRNTHEPNGGNDVALVSSFTMSA